MDDQRFDRYSRTLATALTRRRLVAAALALAGGEALAERGAAAAPTVCRQLGQHCTRSGQCCSGICDPAPGRRGQRRQTCGCPRGQRACRQTCTAVLEDPENCGGCGVACDPLRADGCVGGACACGAGPACRAGKECLHGACFDVTCEGSTAGFCLVSVEGVRYERNHDLIEWDSDPCVSTAQCEEKIAVGPNSFVLCAALHLLNSPSLIASEANGSFGPGPVCVGFADQF
jgi:hypothetical protein